MTRSSDISGWRDWLEPAQREPSAPLRGPTDCDVVIAGAGYTGLWTAYYLKQLAPALDIVLLDARIAGAGASGRNGGWVIGELAGEDRLLSALGPAARDRALAVLRDLPDEIGRVIERERLDCDFRKGGVFYCAARYPEQRTRLRAQLALWHRHGHTEADFRWLDAATLAGRLRVAGASGAVYSPHVATVQPAKLARALARCVAARGVRLYENTPVLELAPGRAVTAGGTVRARWQVAALEAFGGTVAGVRPHQIAVQSLIIATEPLSGRLWDEIGLAHGQAFSDYSRLVSYGQRTADDRLVFGARGGYRFGGRLRRQFALSPAEIALRRAMMRQLFPMLETAAITHGWGGNLGVARRFYPQIVLDPAAGRITPGGFGGEGVGAANLAGRTIAALISGRDDALPPVPWLSAPGGPGRWEPEPLRWLGYNGIVRSFELEDRWLNQPDTPRWQRRLAVRLADWMEALMR